MAEGQSEVEKDLEKEITCIICHEHYTDPKVLPCCHYYCKECIGKLSQKAGSGRPFPCPECRKNTTLPEGGVDSLPTAFFVNRMKAVHSKLVKVPVKQVSDKCEICGEDEPESFCKQCDKYLCEDCAESHRQLKMSRDHEVIELTYKQNDSYSEPLQPVCEKHGKESLQFYCYDCNIVICKSCIATEHKDHRHQLLTKAASDARKNMADQMKPLDAIGKKLRKGLKNVRATKSEVGAQSDTAVEYIKSSFDDIFKIVKNREQALLAEATTKAGKKLKHLSVQEKSLSSSTVAVEAVLGFTKQCLKHLDDGNFMCLHAEIQNRLETLLKQESKENEKSIVPVEVADIEVEVNCIEKVKELCETEAKVSQCSLNCIVSGKGIETAEVNNVAEFKVTLMNTVTSTKQALNVECEFKSLKTESSGKCTVTEVKDGEFCVRYVPTVQGSHELVLTVNGQLVNGSPFSVFVTIHPTQIRKHVKAIGLLNSVRCAAIDNSNNEIIVASSTNILVLDWCGTQLNVSDTTNYGFSGQHYYGVALDNANECIYATCDFTRLVKFSRDLKLLNTFVYQGSSFYGLTVVGDEVMVCDYSSCIKVYNKELKYVRSIGTYGTEPQQIKGVHAISSDGQGNVYVTDEKPSINIFSKDGTFLRSFRSSVGGLYGLFVTSQYVYVASNSGSSIQIFTHQGQLLASLGASVYGVCVDKDGFIYACSFRDCHISIF